MRLTRLNNLTSGLWLVPLLCMAGGAGLALVTIAVDRATGYRLVPPSIGVSSSTAQTVLSTIASAEVTLASLALSLTLVAVQLAMGQFSPRIVGALMSDRRSQAAIGLFVGTFAFALLAVREVNVAPGVVPGLTVLVAYVLAIASVVGLVLYVHHTGQKLRVGGLIDLVGDDLREQLDHLFPPGRAPDADDPALILAPRPGSVNAYRTSRLVAAARNDDCVLELLPAMGDFVPAGAPLLRIHGDGSGLDRDKLAELVTLGDERTHPHDPAYGFRCLVDIAERSIAQPFEDPTTAKQAIDRLHDCLRQLATRRFPSGRHCDDDGEVRFVVRTLDWDGYVRLSFDELRLAGSSSPQVTRRLKAALCDLRTVVPAERRPPIDRQLELLEAGARRSYEDPEDAEAALVADQQGIGSGPDLVMRNADTADDEDEAGGSTNGRAGRRHERAAAGTGS